jgi:hypothetical protein
MNRRLLWSLLLAFLLPLAQVAAAAHELSHVRAPSEAGSKSAPAVAHCDLCAVAAAISGGAAPSTAPVLALPQAAAATPVRPAPAAHIAQAFHAFSSRAPPSLP